MMKQDYSLAPLASFRIIFGLLMLYSTLRFWFKGWIYDLYILPDFHFKYFGFEWVQPLPGWGMYLVFGLMVLSAIAISLGLYYRLAALSFFILFTYVELIDVSNYLNHYYFVSLAALLMATLPAHRYYSLDVKFGRIKAFEKGNFWHVNAIRLLLAVVYFYAGLAKLNSDWLLDAMPLSLWLPANEHLPVIGPLFTYKATAYIFSWGGALYDLSIPFFLFFKKTRPYAYAAVIGFHLITWLLFPIGVFPWVMIFATLVFFSDDFHEKLLSFFKPIFGTNRSADRALAIPGSLRYFLIFFFALQLLLPFRYLAYPGKLFWHEQGYRFSWRVMLMEKAGYVTYEVTDPDTGNSSLIQPAEYLSPWQEKQLSTQPDLILQFAHFLEDEFREEGLNDPEVRAQAYVTLNGKRSKLIINPAVDLTEVEDGFPAKNWILPYED